MRPISRFLKRRDEENSSQDAKNKNMFVCTLLLKYNGTELSQAVIAIAAAAAGTTTTTKTKRSSRKLNDTESHDYTNF